MVYLLSPVRATDTKDLETRYELLRSTVGTLFAVGFEVHLLGGQKGDIAHPKRIYRNLECYKGVHLVVHGPIERTDYKRRWTDLTTSEGTETLERTLDIANNIGAMVVNVHSEYLMPRKTLSSRNLTVAEVEESIKRVIGNIEIARIKAQYKGKVAVENIPYPMMFDQPFNADEMPYEPLMHTASALLMFHKYTTPEIGICFDTAHYGAAMKKIDTVLEVGGELPGIPKEHMEVQPKMVSLVSQLMNRVYHLHVSDFSGIWTPGTPAIEGLVPGDGDLGFRDEITSVLRLHLGSDIGITAEVQEKDISIPIETKKTLEYLVRICSPLGLSG